MGREGTRLDSSSGLPLRYWVPETCSADHPTIVAGSGNGTPPGRRPIYFWTYTETEARLVENWQVFRGRDDGVRRLAVPECAGASHQPARAVVSRCARRHVRSLTK